MGMRYDDSFHRFLEKMQEKLGVSPNKWKHHVFVRVEITGTLSIIGFAFFDESVWNWVVPAIYEALHLDIHTQIASKLLEQCSVYMKDNEIPTERPLPEIPDIRPFVAIQEAKEHESFDELKWGADESHVTA